MSDAKISLLIFMSECSRGRRRRQPLTTNHQPLIIIVDFVPALEFFVERPVNECKDDVADEEH